MSALDDNRNTPESACLLFDDPCAAGVHVYAGAIVVLDSSGNAKPAVTATGLICRGIAMHERDNSDGGAGDLRVQSKAGVFAIDNSAAADEITAAEIGDACFLVDDHTVAKTSASATRSVAGKVMRVEAGQVHVQLGVLASADGDLLASNNLSDVTAATARENIGANRYVLSSPSVSSKASDAVTTYIPVPETGTIVKIWSVLDGALATADMTAQLKYGANVGALANAGSTTTGLITATQVGSAAGDVDSATPLTTNIAVTAGGVLAVTVGGGSTATANVKFYIELKY